MDKSYFRRLLRKYFTSELSSEEQKYIENYYELFQSEPDVLEDLSEGEKAKLRDELKLAIEESIVAETHNNPSRINIHFRKKFISVAAAAILFFMIAGGTLYYYGAFSKHSTIEMVMVQTTDIRSVFLPDGSEVILSEGSKLRYPASFGKKKQREVFLEGKGFFDVIHNPSAPFVVHAGNLETRVLGTAFLIDATKGNENISVTVNRGKVQVSNGDKTLGTIVRDEQIVYSRKNNGFLQNAVNSDELIAWTKMELHVNNLTMGEAAHLLEKHFNVKIQISDTSIRNKRFTTTFPDSVSLDQALKIICEFNGATYQFDKQNDLVIIRDK